MSNSIDDVIIDVIISEEHSYENDVTSHPVESGSDVTDNVINKPLKISLDCLISATPLRKSGVIVQGEATRTANPTQAARARLIAINVAREPITVNDSQGSFPNMVLEKLMFTQTSKIGDALAFKASFKELKIIENERTIIQVAIPRAQAVVKLNTKSGTQPPKNPPDDRDPLRKLAGIVKPGFISALPNPGGLEER